MRAFHLAYDRPVIFEDPFAADLTNGFLRLMLGSRFVYRTVLDRMLGLRPIIAQSVARARYAEDELNKSAFRVRQYVVIGAGMDSFALRRSDLSESLRVYEIDHPATQQTKRERLSGLGVALPANLEFVPANLESESVAAALARSSYSHSEQSFFSWMGTTPYLTKEAVFATLASVSSCAAPGSHLIFDHLLPDDMLGRQDVELRDRGNRLLKFIGEPLITALDPRTLGNELAALGFDLLESLSPAEQKTRYFSARTDSLYPFPEGLVHVTVRGRGPEGRSGSASPIQGSGCG